MWLVAQESKYVHVFFGDKPAQDNGIWLGDNGDGAIMSLNQETIKKMIGRNITVDEGPVEVTVTERTNTNGTR